MIEKAFDKAAKSYDKDFTESNIGLVQRNQVWNYLDTFLEGKKNIKILEINCGSGEDAMRFAKAGHAVKATDISEEMLKIGRLKQGNQYKNLQFDLLDIRDIRNEENNYDLIFSNFGGLNCLSPKELNHFFEPLPNLLNKNGRFIGVIMTNFCFIESLYFLIKLNLSKSFRRLRKKESDAKSINKDLKVFYYGPGHFKKALKNKWAIKKLIGIGITVPPSYLEPLYSKHNTLLDISKNIDLFLGRFSSLAYLSDHFLIDFEIRS